MNLGQLGALMALIVIALLVGIWIGYETWGRRTQGDTNAISTD